MKLFEVLQVVNHKDGPDVRIIYYDEKGKESLDGRVGDYNILNAIEETAFEVTQLDIDGNTLVIAVDRSSISTEE